MRFCNKCGAIIIGSRCTSCFAMQNNSIRLKPLNRDLFIPSNNLNSISAAINHIERGLDNSNLIRAADFSNKLSQNRTNLIDRKLEILDVAKELQKINSEDENIFKNEIANQDPVMKTRLDWIDSVKEDVHLKAKDHNKAKQEIKMETDKISEEKKHNI